MNFKKMRKKAGLTQAAVAKHMGVTIIAVQYWERGTYTPRGDKLVKLAKLYGCTVDELLEEV